MLRRGAGSPVTVFAHGLGSGIPETRALASGVPGSRVFFDFELAEVPEAFSYQDLAGQLAEVADAAGAGQAVGVSMGAGALAALLSREPARFERCVFFLPAVLDRPRPPASARLLLDLAEAAARGDRDRIGAIVAEEVPPELRGDAEAQRYVRRRSGSLALPAAAAALRAAAGTAAVADRASLARVSAACLVVGQRDDPLHPADVSEQLAAALPGAELRIFPDRFTLWRHRAELRQLLSGFLSGPSD